MPARDNRKLYFGTDGIRGSVGGSGVITPDLILKLGWAAGCVLITHAKENAVILIGKDTRISGYMLESALEAGLSAAGVNVCLLGPMPTPGVAFLTKAMGAQAGIVISASHNPFYDNGVKFFSAEGTKLPDSIEKEIELLLVERPIYSVRSRYLGKASRINDAPRRYIDFCKSKMAEGVNLSGLRLVVDCAHGAAYHIAPTVFEELGASVIPYAVEPDGLNINHECGAISTEQLSRLVIENGADAGIALDGDGDRAIMVDHDGHIIDGDEILFIVAQAQRHVLNGAVVGTVMSNLGLEYALGKLGLGLIRARVGDRYVMELLRQRELVLGGETSGHIINLGLSTTGDGIITALQVLQAMILSGKNLQELKKGMSKFPQVIRNVKLPEKIDICLDALAGLVGDIEGVLGSSGRVVLRPSGTEPLVRVMVEGEDASLIQGLSEQLVDGVETLIEKGLACGEGVA